MASSVLTKPSTVVKGATGKKRWRLAGRHRTGIHCSIAIDRVRDAHQEADHAADTSTDDIALQRHVATSIKMPACRERNAFAALLVPSRRPSAGRPTEGLEYRSLDSVRSRARRYLGTLHRWRIAALCRMAGRPADGFGAVSPQHPSGKIPNSGRLPQIEKARVNAAAIERLNLLAGRRLHFR
jgi:hypothetical protein